MSSSRNNWLQWNNCRLFPRFYKVLNSSKGRNSTDRAHFDATFRRIHYFRSEGNKKLGMWQVHFTGKQKIRKATDKEAIWWDEYIHFWWARPSWKKNDFPAYP